MFTMRPISLLDLMEQDKYLHYIPSSNILSGISSIARLPQPLVTTIPARTYLSTAKIFCVAMQYCVESSIL